MNHTYLFDRVAELKEKFRHFFLHKKKLQALENYSDVVQFQHKSYLGLIKKCMDDGFLGEIEANFLCYMVDKYFTEQNYIDWIYKTKWLRGEMARLSANREKLVQSSFIDYSKLDNASKSINADFPFELLAQEQKKLRAARGA